MRYCLISFPNWYRHWLLIAAIVLLAIIPLASCRLSLTENNGDGSSEQGSGCASVVCSPPMVCVQPSGECRDICENDIPCVNNDPCQTMVQDSLCGSFTCNAGGFLSCQLFDPCMIDSCDSSLGCIHESVTDVECAADELCVSEIPMGSNFQGRLGDCAKRCTQDNDCDDSDECTLDVCETAWLSELSTEGLCTNAVIDSCVVVGACCTKDGCFELTESDCMSQNLGEVYQGDGTTCNPSPCFGDFVPGIYTLTGDCLTDSAMVTLVAEGNTLILRGLPENNDIQLAVNGATASAIGVVVSGVSDQNASLAVLADGSILLDISQIEVGTSCRSTMTIQP